MLTVYIQRVAKVDSLRELAEQTLTSSPAVADYPQSDGVRGVERPHTTVNSPANVNSRIYNSRQKDNACPCVAYVTQYYS